MRMTDRLGRLWGAACVIVSAAATFSVASDGINITSPNGGEAYSVGQTITITWQIETDKISGNVVFSFSPDNGVSRYEILSDKDIVPTNQDIYDGANGSVDWTIPDSLSTDYDPTISTISDQCKILALAPYEAFEYTDASDGVFSVDPRAEGGGGDGGCGAGSSAVLAPMLLCRVSALLRRKRKKRA